MAKKSKRYRTTRDIIIPRGTAVFVDGPKTHSYSYEKVSILTAVTRDFTSEWTMVLDEALAVGLVEEVTN